MPRYKCKSQECRNVCIIPPNKAKTATGYCRKCYHGSKGWKTNAGRT
jgi:hypothetical protein